MGAQEGRHEVDGSTAGTSLHTTTPITAIHQT